MFNWRALLAVAIMAGLLSIPIVRYWEFLTKGQQPSNSTLRLNQLEKEGVPDFTLEDLSGKKVSLHDFKGKAVLVNLWASWCGPCVKEFPSLKNLVEKFHGQLAVLAVSHDHTREDLDSFVATFGAVPKDFVIVWDKNRSTGELFGTDQLPETYILDKDQKLVRKVAGEQVWDDPMALNFFRDVLQIQ